MAGIGVYGNQNKVEGSLAMDVKIFIFPETKVAAIEHHGSPTLEHDTARKLIAWKLAHRFLDPLKYRSYGVHHTNPRTTPHAEHRVDFCLSIEEHVGPNPYGISNKLIPGGRRARARDVGGRSNNQAAAYLYDTWLPQSSEFLGNFPIFFYDVNVGPCVRQEEMITDVYLPLK